MRPSEAAADVHAAYTAASSRAADDALRVRARLHAELEFARWLVHGAELRRTDIVDDAAALLESLADGLRSDDLRVVAAYTGGVDSALDVLDRVPETAAATIDTSMQTDAYRPEDLLLWQDEDPTEADNPGAESPDDADAPDDASSEAGTDARPSHEEHGSWEESTQDLSEVSGVRGSTRTDAKPSDADASPSSIRDADDSTHGSDLDSAEEAQRAARAALQRWTNSDSE